MKYAGAFCLFLLCWISLVAQTPACPFPEDLSSKALKLYEKALDSKKKTTSDDRIDYLRGAIDDQDDFTSAYELLSELLFQKSKLNPENISDCKAITNKWMELCELHNPKAHYILGALAFMQSEPENALAQFEIFLDKSTES